MANTENTNPVEGNQDDNTSKDSVGSSFGISGSSNDADEQSYSRVAHDGGSNTVPGDTGGGADNGSKSGSRLGTDGSASNAGGQAEGSAADNI